MRSEGGKPSDKPTFPALAVGHHLGIRVFRPPSQQPAGREGDISATFRRAGPLQRLAKSPPGEFLEPPRGFWNEHGDASGVPAKTNTFQAKPAPVWSGFGGRKRYRLSGCYGDVRGAVAPDHVVAEHIWTVHA